MQLSSGCRTSISSGEPTLHDRLHAALECLQELRARCGGIELSWRWWIGAGRRSRRRWCILQAEAGPQWSWGPGPPPSRWA